jgi:hypothetical protein
MLSAVHEDASALRHFARRDGESHDRSMMPLTGFVYEFFMYNTIYSIDWRATCASAALAFHPIDKAEGGKQQALEDFLRPLADAKPSAIRSGFQPLVRTPFRGPWREVNPDASITKEDGDRFFAALEDLLRYMNTSDAELRGKMGNVFSRVQTARLFVYRIRNNIFHGSKTLGEVWEPEQRMRLDVYFRFLEGLNSTFFLLAKTEPSLTIA